MPNARWVQVKVSANHCGLAGQIGGNGISPQAAQSQQYTQWLAVDEDDEILAVVNGDGQMWYASEQFRNGFHGHPQPAGVPQLPLPRSGTFISEDGAKRRVEAWFSHMTFLQPQQTGWVYKLAP